MPKKKMTAIDEMLEIPTFLQRAINPEVNMVGYERVDGKLYKVDEAGNLYNANTNKLKKGKNNVKSAK